MKRVIKLLIVIMALLGLMSCSAKQGESILYDNTADASDMKAIDVTQQIEALSMPNDYSGMLSVVYDIDELKNEGVVDIVRFNKGKYYSVTPIKNNGYLFLLFDDNNGQLQVVDGILASSLSDKEVLKDIKVGMKLEEVVRLDPAALISDTITYHRFKDKSVMKIDYELDNNNQYVISEFGFIKDPVSVLDYLLPKDFKLITN